MGRVVWRVTAAVAVASGLQASQMPLAAQGERVASGIVQNAADSTPIAEVILKVLDAPSGRIGYSSATGRFELAVS